MHGVLVVKDEVLKKHPWVAQSLFDAFTTAKNQYLEQLKAGKNDDGNDKRYREFMSIIGPDPLPYGIKANLPTIEALAKYAFQQGLLPKRMSTEDLFVNVEG